MNKGDRTVQASWCFFRGSGKVREAVKHRMSQKDITAKKLCEDLGIAPYRMSLYLHNRIPNLNQYQLYQICEKLDIRVKINIELDL